MFFVACRGHVVWLAVLLQGEDSAVSLLEADITDYLLLLLLLLLSL